MSAPSPFARYGMRSAALTYLALLLVIPLGMIFYETFKDGLQAPIDAVTSPEGITPSTSPCSASGSPSR